jgi:hypothetical protein
VCVAIVGGLRLSRRRSIGSSARSARRSRGSCRGQCSRWHWQACACARASAHAARAQAHMQRGRWVPLGLPQPVLPFGWQGDEEAEWASAQEQAEWLFRRKCELECKAPTRGSPLMRPVAHAHRSAAVLAVLCCCRSTSSRQACRSTSVRTKTRPSGDCGSVRRSSPATSSRPSLRNRLPTAPRTDSDNAACGVQAEAAAQRASEQAEECELSLGAAEQLKALLEEKNETVAALEATQRDALRERDEINAKVATVRIRLMFSASCTDLDSACLGHMSLRVVGVAEAARHWRVPAGAARPLSRTGPAWAAAARLCRRATQARREDGRGRPLPLALGARRLRRPAQASPAVLLLVAPLDSGLVLCVAEQDRGELGPPTAGARGVGRRGGHARGGGREAAAARGGARDGKTRLCRAAGARGARGGQ